jgi:hypothetical protein
MFFYVWYLDKEWVELYLLIPPHTHIHDVGELCITSSSEIVTAVRFDTMRERFGGPCCFHLHVRTETACFFEFWKTSLEQQIEMKERLLWKWPLELGGWGGVLWWAQLYDWLQCRCWTGEPTISLVLMYCQWRLNVIEPAHLWCMSRTVFPPFQRSRGTEQIFICSLRCSRTVYLFLRSLRVWKR